MTRLKGVTVWPVCSWNLLCRHMSNQ